MDQELIAYLDESFRSLREYVDGRFERVEEEMRHTREEVRQTREEVRQTQGEVHQTQEEVRHAREEIRHTQILVEGVRGDVRLVAEGTFGLDERLGFFRKEVQQEFEDVRKLIRPVYSSLDQRIRTLEVRKDLQGRDPIELIKERFGLGEKPE